MKKSTLLELTCAISMAISLAACETPPPLAQPAPPAPPAPLPLSRANSIDHIQTTTYPTIVEQNFSEGLYFYDNGDYTAAIKKFQSQEMSKAWPELRVRTLKYLAFSYCLINMLQACQKSFNDALQVNPQFKLELSEKDHPIWGPVFQKEQQNQQKHYP